MEMPFGFHRRALGSRRGPRMGPGAGHDSEDDSRNAPRVSKEVREREGKERERQVQGRLSDGLAEVPSRGRRDLRRTRRPRTRGRVAGKESLRLRT